MVRLADSVVLLSGGAVEAVGPVAGIMSRLDLGQLASRRDAGAVLEVTVEAHDDEDGLSTLAFSGGRLTVPRIPEDPRQRSFGSLLEGADRD